MNKQTGAPKARKGVYIKFTLLMIVSALTGAFISIFLRGQEGGVQGVVRQISDGLILAGPWLLALGLVPCAVAHGLYRSGLKAAARADEDDDAFETANRRLGLSLVFSTVVMPWIMLTICLALPSVDVLANNAFVVAVVPLLVVELAWSYGLQAMVVRATQRLAPEKRGNVFDIRFQKDWYASCDEAERQRIGECAYHTYITMTSIYPFTLLVALLAVMYGGASVLWALLLGGLWLTQTLSYLLRAYKLEHGKSRVKEGFEQ